MKKVLAIAIAAALASPMGLAANTPDNVGDVTYMGNIVANSPMWQWTVNDYPGGRLDAKPSEATTANGVTTYPLNGQAFIAVSGYLPSVAGVLDLLGKPVMGYRELAQVTDSTGAAPRNWNDEGDGAVSFTLTATGATSAGTPVSGTLKLKATELRVNRTVFNNGGTYSVVARLLSLTEDGSPHGVAHCFVGNGSYASAPNTWITGSALAPKFIGSPTAAAAVGVALAQSDSQGNAPKLTTYAFTNDNTYVDTGGCSISATAHSTTVTGGQIPEYIAAAQVMETRPVELSFPQPISGAWSATMTVTASQM